jgi:hypothetical protein
MLLCRIRPDLCWIGLLPLDFWPFTDPMLFAGYADHEDAQHNSNNAPAKERTHNALAQLSVSRRACKAKARRKGVTAGSAESFDHDYQHEQEHEHEHEHE